jgi:hypothetical protein
MTKDDLMANWDAVVTDRRLTLDLVEGHLAGLEADAYLFGQFHAVASGGSSGRRGIFVFGWRAWATAYAGFMRPALLDRAVTPELAAVPMRVAMIGARNATHMTSAIPQTFANPAVDIALFPVTQPIGQIVAGLNVYQPLALMGYPSMLVLLAAEARAGRLRILPRRITTTSEPLLPEVRQALTEAFCAPVANMYGTSEAGPVGVWVLQRPRHPPLRRPGHHRAGRPGRPPGPARGPLRQALRDRPGEPDPAADPLRAHPFRGVEASAFRPGRKRRFLPSLSQLGTRLNT